METLHKYDAEAITRVLHALEDSDVYGLVLRAKGIVQNGEGEWLHFDYVPEEADVRKGSAAHIGKLCVIGSQLDTEALENLFLGAIKE